MRLHILLLLSLATLFTSCGKYTEQVSDLYNRISSLEQQLLEANSQTISMLESGSCTLTDIKEDSARLVCGD